MSVNKAIIMGRLGKDPELKFTPGGTAVCNFSIATSRKWKGQDGQKQEATTWHNIVAWGKQAEAIKQYFVKGQEAHIIGRIDNRSYEAKDGTKKYISEVVLDEFSFTGSKADNEQASTADSAPRGGRYTEDDDLPF